MDDEGRSLRKFGHAALTLWFVVLFGLAWFRPRSFALAFQEDGWGEWGTFFAFICASVLFGLTGWRAWRQRVDRDEAGLAIALVWALAAGCFFVAGEEISWGQRLFGVVPSELFLQRNFQQEINAHNLIETIGVRSDWLTAALALGYGCLLPLVGVFAARAGKPDRSWGLPDFEYAGWFAMVALGAAVVPFDLGVEAVEMQLGLLFTIDATHRYLRMRPVASSAHALRFSALVWGLIIGFGIATPAVLDHFVYRASERERVLVDAELRALAADLSLPTSLNGAYFRSLGSIHKRIFNAERQKFARIPDTGQFSRLAPVASGEGEVDREKRRRRYFIDPWGTPYWLAYNKDLKGMLVYSMGPNRRRDTHLGTVSPEWLAASRMEGDDVGVWVDFSERLESRAGE